MIKRLLKIVSVLLLITLCVGGVFFYSIFVSVERLNVSYETISSTKIPLALNNVKIAFISDLEYNHFMDKDRLRKMISTINDAKPDVIIFGGDIFNQPQTNVPDDAIKQEVAQLLETIEAPLGKFAVLGEQDHTDEATLTMVKDILYTSNFELLDNTSVKIRNGSNESISLIGIDSEIKGSIDFDQAFSNVNAEEFNILAMHCPDTILNSALPKSSLSLVFAGHSHSSQIYIPFVGSLSSETGAQKYNHGKHTIDNLTLHITNGLGTNNMDMRLFSPPQMLVYRLESLLQPMTPEPPKEETPTPDPSTPPKEETPATDPSTPPAEETPTEPDTPTDQPTEDKTDPNTENNTDNNPDKAQE